MAGFRGGCLCGAIRYAVKSDPVRVAHCHCDDCRKATGSSFATNVFVKQDDLVVLQGSPRSYRHTADSGATMTKEFCGDCGSQLFGLNSAQPNSLRIRAGVLDQTSLVKPSVNAFLDSRIESTPIDPDVKGFPKMPG